MSKLICIALLVLIFPIAEGRSGYTDVKKAEDLDMDTLMEIAKRTGYTDHIPHFLNVFKSHPVKNFLEFGLGFSTKCFLDNCENVISVEFVTHGTGPAWIKQCLPMFDNYGNWTPISYFSNFQGDPSWSKNSFFGTREVCKAATYQCINHKSYAEINPAYMKELDKFIEDLISHHEIEVAFVDCGIYIRGDIVQLLFNRVPIIAAHDARCRAVGEKNDVYAYSRISPPDNYEEIFIDAGMGTMFWITKDPAFEPVRQSLKAYINNREWELYY